MVIKMTKTYNLIEEIRNALAPRYEFPYYSLVRIHTRHAGTFHIPAPQFDGMSRRSIWAGNLPIASDKRDGEYYECPVCGETSFYSGVCSDCRKDFEVWEGESDNFGEWVEGPLPIEYQNHEALKNAVKEEFLRRLDAGLELGVISAEIVLSDGPHDHCETQSPFLNREEYSAERALDRIERVIRAHEELKENEEYQKIIREYIPADGIPLEYVEGDEITVEGTDEIRRYQNDIWQHKHGEYEYWHPMARIHKNSCVKPFCNPEE